MKLISYTQDNATRYGVLLGQTVVDMRHCMDKAPDSINDFFAQASGNPALMASIAQRAAKAESTPLDQVSLLPCVPRPSKILCLGVNYHDHAAEGGNKVADYPTIFFRGPSS
jgi:2-keto-4-pentenoate hydratase/2-oxohepta-3-ene-1,7-dioic acid hydratase in catechol pathway